MKSENNENKLGLSCANLKKAQACQSQTRSVLPLIEKHGFYSEFDFGIMIPPMWSNWYGQVWFGLAQFGLVLVGLVGLVWFGKFGLVWKT